LAGFQDELDQDDLVEEADFWGKNKMI
jgi:hypothetical protein